ncbi:hypothetical protein [Actinoplanes derwentensis]|uniref:ABC-2 type transport system permease protein n=1 Tax=Actinoplanes derwentensis TaxID=113562 RepID=A0A1H2CDB9_9ACTN|nr:hypothetical protein [Actinoplanes derwentensis]GID87313.1 hypothetical protein Ade03nite_62370 [Actinoplanes derwentensis]SDT68096.1 hypothetical protein SAMN04489716_5572 [Actinoplanes derwentensis]
MVTVWRLTRLLLVNRLRQEGAARWVERVVVLNLLNIFVLAAVFATAGGRRLAPDILVTQYSYFIPLAALTAGVGAWETELFAGLADEYLLRPGRGLAARLLLGLVESAAPVVLFLTLLLTSAVTRADRLSHLMTAVLMLIVFLLLGTALGYCFGFRHEKAVNNFLTSVAWVLGLGPGPFFQAGDSAILKIFPGGHSLHGQFGPEWGKLAFLLLVGLGLIAWGTAPRRHRSFTR